MGSLRGWLAAGVLVVLAACGSSASEDAPSGDDGGPSGTDASIDAPPPPEDATADAPSNDAGIDARDADADADAGDAGWNDPPSVTAGAADKVLLVGTIVTPDVSFDGQVLVEGADITCALPGTACAAQPGAIGATRIDTHGVIAPGLVDTHNHILFDVFDDADWLPSQLYQNHDQWTDEARYQAMLDVKQCLANDSQGKPAWCAQTTYGTSAGSLRCEMDKWGELKGLVAGTTSIVGLPGTSSACFGSLARSIDVAQNGLGSDKIQTSAIFPPSRSTADGVCDNFASGKTNAFLIHVGEGVDPGSLAEWTKLGTVSTTAGCLYAPQTVITHGTAFTPAVLAQMAAYGMALTWSPKSNVALYGATTDIPSALAANVTIALAPDWSMGGSSNLLDEMRFADAWDNAHFANVLSAKDLVAMTTKNAAKALALDARIGSIQPGRAADLMVVTRTTLDPWASIVAASAKSVRMTMVGGKVLYGDAPLAAAMPQAPGCETIDVCGVPKLVCVAEATTADKLGQTFADIKAALEAAMLAADALTPDDGYSFAPLAPLVKCN